MTLRQLVYDSCPTIMATSTTVDRIACESHVRNALRNITGVLAYDGETFMQVLEGPSDAVYSLMNSIERDQRHSNLTILVDEIIDRRQFGRWSMAYLDARNLTGLKDDLTTRDVVDAMAKYLSSARPNG